MIWFSATVRDQTGGRSSEFAAGLLVRDGGRDLTGEGMGIGSVALRTAGFTCFPRTSLTVQENNKVTRTFLVDSRIVWKFGGIASFRLTGIMERLVTWYKAHSSVQKVLLPISGIHRLAMLEPAPDAMEPVAEARFIYNLEGSAVQISCAVRSLRDSLPEVWLLNELGADIFTASLQDGTILPAPPGWEALNGQFPTPALYDPSRLLWFRVAGVRTGPGVTSCTYWGREKRKELDWAGFAIRLDPGDRSEVDCTYSIEFGGAGAAGMVLV
jgi:hypothetical protein